MSALETPMDRANQTEVVEYVAEYFKNLPVLGSDLDGGSWFELIETEQRLMECADFRIMYQGRWIGVGEIKCRDYPCRFFRCNGWVLKNAQLKRLREEHHKHGRQVLLVLKTNDDYVLGVQLTTLIRNRNRLIPAPDRYITSDHGKRKSNGKGLIVPFALMHIIHNPKEKPWTPLR